MGKDMVGENFSIKTGVGMMVNGRRIKCKVMVNYSINQINLLIKGIG
jgi:hypothetical protein